MVRWGEFRQKEPEFAAGVQALFDAGRHKTIATLRADGSPRISGIECEFDSDDLRFGSMSGARKGADLARDPRLALHSPSVDPVEGQERDWPGEAKIAGRAFPLATDAANADATASEDAPGGDAYAVDISEVVLTRLNAEATRLVVRWWTPTTGFHEVERD